MEMSNFIMSKVNQGRGTFCFLPIYETNSIMFLMCQFMRGTCAVVSIFTGGNLL